ncbi:hypothetical protein [Niveispirillum sp.]|uniref:hypothetical protein n=1 Tax=Niveispirillum sp. TaxID=1917217 RepID=UPI001B4B226A|nr:hypothetical protein [Niveispirillum sp.]MBP7340149.1 hypothetical protein [Niveispirillum sp.]
MLRLKQAGLVVDRRDAQWMRYRLSPDLPPATFRLLAAALERDAPTTCAAAA